MILVVQMVPSLNQNGLFFTKNDVRKGRQRKNSMASDKKARVWMKEKGARPTTVLAQLIAALSF